MGLLNGVYGGIGQSLGSLIGGALSRRLGIPKSFFYCAGVDLAILVAFLGYQGAVKIAAEKSKVIESNSANSSQIEKK